MSVVLVNQAVMQLLADENSVIDGHRPSKLSPSDRRDVLRYIMTLEAVAIEHGVKILGKETIRQRNRDLELLGRRR